MGDVGQSYLDIKRFYHKYSIALVLLKTSGERAHNLSWNLALAHSPDINHYGNLQQDKA